MGRVETIEIGSAPHGEPCAQVGDASYGIKAHVECRAYARQLLRHAKDSGKRVPDGLRLFVKRNVHDFGEYYEVACRFDEGDEAASELAWWLVGNAPDKWDDESLAELAADGTP